MSDDSDLVAALRPVVAEFQRLGVRYYLGGSVASSFHGASRSTLDVDIAAELDEANASRFVDALKSQYYVSEAAVREAMRFRTCFNLIHLATSFKVDIFVSRNREFDRQAQQRALDEKLGAAEPMDVRVASPEDILLAKLEWFRLGNESSERQWSDVMRVASLQRSRLDLEYLRHWAQELGVLELLERLLSAAQIAGQ
ncbi:MAG TPA: hypothetical protein VMV10_10290 [Pirellulales bacterium]|nr:hypothetical protein [Pirellulales bacterium]